MGELKKLADDRSALLEEAEQSKKKLARDMETLQGRVDELSANNSKLEKTRKRLQDEVRGVITCWLSDHFAASKLRIREFLTVDCFSNRWTTCNLIWRRRDQRSVRWKRNRESLIRFVHFFVRCGVKTCPRKWLWGSADRVELRSYY